MDLASPQDIYARSLVSRRGYPLWTPEPSMTLPDVYRQQGLKIGDVGVVVPEDGSFDVFFNICLPPTHSLHRPTGVPNHFTPIRLEDRDIAIFPEAESAGRIISSSSVARIGAQTSNETTTRVSGPLDYEFTLSSKEGALLILPEGAERYYLRNQRPFLEEAIKHAIDWYNFAEDRLGRIISHDSLYLITGFYKACSWSLASYQQASTIGGVYAQFKAMRVGGGNISRSYTWEATQALDWRVGPSDHYYNGIANQSVFIQGFKIAVRSSILGAKRVKVKADMPVVRPHQITFYSSSRRSNIGTRASATRFSAPSTNAPRETDADSNTGISEENSDSSSIVGDSGEDISIRHIPQVPKPFHPSDIINRFLLRSHPSAEVAITHDTQWSTLLEIDLLGPDEIVQEDRLEELVHNMLPVFCEGVVYLRDITSLSENSNAADDEIVYAQLGISVLPLEEHNTKTEDSKPHFRSVDPKKPAPASTARGEVWNMPPIGETQPFTPYESGSSRANSFVGPAVSEKPLPQGSRNANMSDTDKERSPPSPSIPRMPGFLELPEPYVNFTTGQEAKPSIRTGKSGVPQKQPRFSSSASFVPGAPKLMHRALPAVGSVAKPLNPPPRGSHVGDEKSTAKKMTRLSVPHVLPPGSRLVPMKPPAYDLYWILLPYDPRRSKRLLRFDVAFPIDEIVFQDYGLRTKVSDAELNKSAVNGTMTDMRIAFNHGPFLWELDVQNAFGIRCRDVFQTIYTTFDQQLTLEERKLVDDRQTVEEAFRLRCKLSRSFPEVERSFGWKRVDVLLHQTIFLGLTQPKSGSNWVLNLGTLPMS